MAIRETIARLEAIYPRLDVQWDGDIPLYLRVADGNESDSAIFAKLLADFKQQWQIDALFVADAALIPREISNKCKTCVGCQEFLLPRICPTIIRK